MGSDEPEECTSCVKEVQPRMRRARPALGLGAVGGAPWSPETVLRQTRGLDGPGVTRRQRVTQRASSVLCCSFVRDSSGHVAGCGCQEGSALEETIRVGKRLAQNGDAPTRPGYLAECWKSSPGSSRTRVA
jgi:hypothetical protein